MFRMFQLFLFQFDNFSNKTFKIMFGFILTSRKQCSYFISYLQLQFAVYKYKLWTFKKYNQEGKHNYTCNQQTCFEVQMFPTPPTINRPVIFPVAFFCCSVPRQTVTLLVEDNFSLPCSVAFSLWSDSQLLGLVGLITVPAHTHTRSIHCPSGAQGHSYSPWAC